MARGANKKLQEMTAKRIRRSTLRNVVGVLACVVVFCVTYALILPAITLTADLTLTCPYEVHRHSDACFDGEGNLVCGMADYVLHTHDKEYCYDGEGKLVCPLPELKAHEHDEACYDEETGELICTEPVIIPHTHSEDCYEDVLDEDGNTVGQRLVCGLLQVEEHQHGDGCMTAAEAEENAVTAGEELNSARMSGTCEGINYTLTPDAGGGYRLILSAGTSSVIPSGLLNDTTIKDYKAQISTVEIGAGITEIGADAFAKLSELRTVSFATGSAITTIGSGAFAGCTNLDAVNLDACTSLTTIGGGDTIDAGAFSGSGLTEITVPGSVTTVGDFAFSGCGNLVTVNFAENTAMTNMGAYVFANCTSLESVNLEALTGENLSFGTKDTVTFGEGETAQTITNASGLFYGCTSLQSLTLPDMGGSVAYLCKGCSALTELNMSNCTKLICDEDTGNANLHKMIDGCTSLEKLDLSGVTGMTVFWQGIVGGEIKDGIDNSVASGVKTVILPSTVTRIGHTAFGWSNVEEVRFTPDKDGKSLLKEVGGTNFEDQTHLQAFASATKIKELDIQFDKTAQQSELFLLTSAFLNCTDLERLSISSPAGLNVLGEGCFADCSSLQDLTWDVKKVNTVCTWGWSVGTLSKNIRFTVGPNVEVLPGYLLSSLKNNITQYAFTPNHSFYIDGAAGVPFTEAGCYYADTSGNLYRLKETTAELVYASRSGSGAFTVPGTVTAIMCTAGGRADTETTFTVTGVGTDAFMGTAYRSINFANPENITSLKDSAFAGAYDLEIINEKTTEQEIKASFTNSAVTFGHDLFVGTKIESQPFENGTGTPVYPGAEAFGTTNKVVQISAASNSIITAIKNQNHLATGETASVTVGVSKNDSDRRVRIYLKVNDPDSFTLTGTVGSAAIQSSSVNGVYYCDVPVIDPSTHTLGITCHELVAPNKKAYVWLLEADSADVLTAIGKEVIEPGGSYPAEGTATATASSQYLEITWDVLAKEYSVVKAANDTITPSVRKTGGADSASTVVGLSFNISNSTANRETTDGKSYDSYGADFVESVSFEDTLTLPEGLKWKDGLLTADFVSTINADNAGGSITATVGNTDYTLCTLSLASGSLTELDCTVDNGNLKVTWTTANRDRTTEITAAVTTLTYGPEVIEVTGTAAETTEYKVTNTVTATPKYTYSGTGATKTAEAARSLTAKPSDLSATKVWVKQPARMGEEAVYKITLDHLADATASADVDIYDDLDIHQYLAADEIEKMLLGEGYDGENLTVTVNNAVLLPVPTPTTVTAVDGKTTAQTTVRSAATVPVYDDLAKFYDYTSAILTMKKAENDTYIILTVETVDKTTGEITATATHTVGSGKDYGSLQTALDSVGYVRSIRGSCTLHWHFPKDSVQAADSHREYELHTFVKNTFQVLTEDHNTSIVADVGGESHNYPVSNKLYLSTADKDAKTNAIQTDTVYPLYDLSIDKISAVNGEVQNTTQLAALLEKHEDFVIDYSLDIRHYGTGTYGLLPVVDHMTGVQALLAEVADNTADRAAPSWATYAETATLDGKQYYVLNANGAEKDTPVTYDGVWLGNGYADSVTVKKTDEGLDTLIKWYYIDNAKSDYTLTPSYRAVCSLNYAGHVSADIYHFVYNEAWLNDIPTRRLHDNIGAEGASIAFEKHIVTEAGAAPDKDVLWPDSTTPYPIPGAGAEITYRLDFKNTGSLGISLMGSDFYDVLPAVAVNAETNTPVFEWTKDNVKISYKTVGDGVTVSDKTASGYNIVRAGEGSENYQIRWDNNFSITYPAGVNGEVYIYVTLTYPMGEAWTQYVAAKQNAMLYNSLYVRDVASRVTHTLPNPGEAMLRKGVFETGYYVLDKTGYTYQYFRGADRNHYVRTAADSQTVKNTVTYFVTLYNSSSTANLYLSPIYDLLPEGFQFYGMVTTPYYPSDVSAGYSGSVSLWYQWSNPKRQADSVGLTFGYAPPLAKPANANLIIWEAEDGTDNTVKVRAPYTGQMLTFDVTLDADHKDELGYFLKPGEAIQFGYMCFTGDAAVDSADNRCAMEYLDYSRSGVTLTAEEKQTVTVDNSVFTAPANTGAARLITNDRAAALGFTQTNPANLATNRQWLISRVSLTEGDIIPGITTKVDSYNVQLGESVGWTVTTTNSGTNAMRDYTLTDTIQSPFNFTGKVGYKVLSNNANADSVAADERDRKEVIIAGYSGSDYLFEITEVSTTGVTLVSNKGESVTVPYDQEQELTVSVRFLQSAAASASYEDANITVSFTKANNGDMTMTINFADSVWSIPADGQSLLTVSTAIPADTKDANGVYVNNAAVTPTQSFDATSVNQGTVSSDGRSDSSAASVNIYTGILTTAYKEVTVGDSYGVSPNYEGKGSNGDTVLLTDKSKTITYTLNVNGASESNMQKLVVIDTLPQTGDTNPINDNLQRGSKFKVNFAENPNVTVQIVTKDSDGNVTKTEDLASSSYTVQYSTKINKLGKDTDYQADKEDENVWHSDLQTGDRSIRVVINRAIAENETVKISFQAQIDQSATGDDVALPGETAWNNFGYSFYTNAEMWLYAAPQKVGVTLKSAPTVQKTLVNRDGDTVKAVNDATFQFVIYKGSDVTFDDYTAATVGTALADKEFTYVSVPVKAGESSGGILLNPATTYKYTYTNNTFTPTETLWTWEEDATYTVVELAGSDDEYVNNQTYTFTYDQTRNQAVTVYNTRHDWSITLTKTSERDKDSRLPGAVFGLYSVKENRDIVERFAAFGLPADTATSYLSADGTTWYLTQIAVTDSDGKLTWSDLCEDSYIVLELRAPDGYIPSTVAYELKYAAASNYIVSLEVSNKVGYELPMSGGMGTTLFTVAGLMLLTAAAVTLVMKRRRA